MTLKPRTRERILAVLMEHRHRLNMETLRNYSRTLIAIAQHADLDDVTATEKAITLMTGNLLDSAIAAYRHYCRHHGLREPRFLVRRDRRRPLPRIPQESTLQASLVVPKRLKWQAYFRLLEHS